jgi:hypothetical protein
MSRASSFYPAVVTPGLSALFRLFHRADSLLKMRRRTRAGPNPRHCVLDERILKEEQLAASAHIGHANKSTVRRKLRVFGELYV